MKEVNNEQVSSAKLLSIQYLRGIAAFMVVLHHIRNPWPKLYNPFETFDLGASGVDIFFIISGVVMYVSSRTESARTFLGLRLIRVGPPYWILTGCALVLFVAVGLMKPDARSLLDALFSLAFLPHHSSLFPGTIWPIVNPGWTLYFEMFFYLIFAAGLVLKRPVLVTSCIIVSLVGIGLAMPADDSIFHAYSHPIMLYTHPLMLEFLCGVLLGWCFVNAKSVGSPLLFPVGFLLLLIAHLVHLPNLLAINGACAAIIMAGAISLERKFEVPEIRLLHKLGDASYSIYLTHSLVLFVVRRIFIRLPFEGPLQFGLFALVAASLSLAVGFLFYSYVERPMTRRLRSAFLARYASRGRDRALQGMRTSESRT